MASSRNPSPGKGLKVFLIDDDTTSLATLEEMLRACQYDVTVCNRADFALSSLRASRRDFDIVLCDVHMPFMDGFEFLDHVVMDLQMPVVLMSADNSKTSKMRGLNKGAVQYLTKPVQMENLLNIWQYAYAFRLEVGEEEEESEGEGDEQRLALNDDEEQG